MNSPVGITFVDPARVADLLDLKNGESVADFGCGAGFFSFEFAKRVAPDGRVYALDVLPSALEAVNSRAKTLGVANVITKRVNLENERGSTLAPDSMQWVILKDMLFQNEKKEVILREASRVLKSNGRALIMEWNPADSLVGPEKHLRIMPERIRSLLEASHLKIEKEIPVGGFHYAYLAKKA